MSTTNIEDSLQREVTIAIGDADPEKVKSIVQGLPPEEREKVLLKDGQVIGPKALVDKVAALIKGDDSHGTAGD